MKGDVGWIRTELGGMWRFSCVNITEFLEASLGAVVMYAK